MFGYLRNELASLRAANDELKAELRSAEDQIRDLKSMSDASDDRISSFRARIQDLTRANDLLVKEVFKYRHEAGNMRRRHKAKYLQTATKLTVVEKELEQASATHIAEVNRLKQSLKLHQKQAEQEKHSLKHEILLLQEKHEHEVQELREDLGRTQESHHEYLTQLMQILETTQSKREQDTARLSAELNAIKETKDAQIEALQQEVMILRAATNAGVEPEVSRTISSSAGSPSMEVVNNLRKHTEMSMDQRARHTAQFDDTVQSLRSFLSKLSSQEMAQGTNQTDACERMEEMVDILDHIYKMEEDSREKADQASFQLMDQYVAVATTPARANFELTQKLSRLESEAAKLREELREKESCKRCAIREAAAKRRIHSSTRER